jgi:hypothetical protein
MKHNFYIISELNYNSINGYTTCSVIVPDCLLTDTVDRMKTEFLNRYELTENDEDLYTQHYGNAAFLSAFDDKHNTTIMWYELDKPTLQYYQKLGDLMNGKEVDLVDLEFTLATLDF